VALKCRIASGVVFVSGNSRISEGTVVKWLSLPVLLAAVATSPATAADLSKLDRTPPKEPTYATKSPEYALLVFGPEAKDRVWLVRDGDTLYVDRNGNGDLTDPQDKVSARVGPSRKPEDGFLFEVGELTVGGKVHKGLEVDFAPASRYAKNRELGKLPAFRDADPSALVTTLFLHVASDRFRGGGVGGRVTQQAGCFDRNGVLRFAANPANAPVIHLDGPLEITFYGYPPIPRIGGQSDWILAVGTSGLGGGTFAMIGHDDTMPEADRPIIEVAYTASAGGSPVKARYEMTKRCCGVNLYGPVSAPAEAGPGPAEVRIAFDAWKDGHVAPTTHRLDILPAKPAPKPEPFSPNLIASLPHPDPTGCPWQLRFSEDGRRLFTYGYPSGVVQFWDVAEKKEIRRFTTASGMRGAADYALLSPDWNTLYVVVRNRKVTRFEKDGKPAVRYSFDGEIQVWDVTTGEARPSLKVPANRGPSGCVLSPDGNSIICSEQLGYESDQQPKTQSVVWDVKTGTRRVLLDDYVYPFVSSDNKTLVTATSDWAAKTSALRVLDLATGRELVKEDCPEKEKYYGVIALSVDGVAAVSVAGQGEGRSDIVFRDSRTLADRGKYTGTDDPERYGWGGTFSPDGRFYVVADKKGTLRLWDVAAGKTAVTCPVGHKVWKVAFSPDGKTLAAGWMNESENGSGFHDPKDYNPLKVSVFDLTAPSAPPRVLVGPPGWTSSLAFSPDGKTLAVGASGAVHLFDAGRK
jgi:WD40 repeat protein